MRQALSRLIVGTLVVAAFSMQPGRALASERAWGSVTLNMTVTNSTSLRVSSSTLRFEASDPASPATVAIDFTAAARTYKGGDVILSVEAAGAIETPDGRPANGVVVVYQGEGAAGTVDPSGRSTAGRWTGSGIRQGRVVFTLRGATVPGSYVLPVRFALSTP